MDYITFAVDRQRVRRTCSDPAVNSLISKSRSNEINARLKSEDSLSLLEREIEPFLFHLKIIQVKCSKIRILPAG